jgi:hypothetical protein
MKGKFILFLSLATLSLGAFAGEGFKEYSVNVLDMPQTLPVSKVSDMQNSLAAFAENVKSCITTSGGWENFAIERNFSYSINQTSVGCKLDMLLYSGAPLSCLLPKQVLNDLASAINDRADSGDVMGDFSEHERQVFFESGYCD